MTYSGKGTLVTGGSKGIGASIVRAFAKAGSRVVFCARGAKDGKALARKTGATFLDCDVSKVGEVRSLVDETVRLHGRLDCLVNNAGTHPGHRPIDGFSEEDFRELLELNVVSMFAACRRALPHLRKTKGNIINVSSLVARMGQLHAATYVATKGAVTALTKALAVDEAAHDVRVNSVSPGNVWTPLWARAVEASEDPRKCRADGEAAQLLGRMGTIEEAGRLCLFIAAEATFTTGVDHVLSGGAELAYGRKTRKER